MSNVQVSVSCITYNQVEYIEDAIKSFLMQKTNFEYEILIHDDASTDGTAEIVKEYAEKYPSIIKAVFQTENQFSKGIKVARTFLYPLFRGKYVAVCEGDDYWISEDKLQKQFEYMESHEECNLCIHGSYDVMADSKEIVNINKYADKLSVYGMGDAISGLGRKVATNSFFYRKEKGIQFPEFREIAPCGDYVLPIVCAENGSIAYLPEIMSAHRIFAKGSLSSAWRADPEKKKKYNLRYDMMLKGIDEYTNYQYSRLLENESVRIWFDYYVATRKIEDFNAKQYRSYFMKLPLKQKTKVLLELICPGVFEMIRGKIMLVKIRKNKNTYRKDRRQIEQ